MMVRMMVKATLSCMPSSKNLTSLYLCRRGN